MTKPIVVGAEDSIVRQIAAAPIGVLAASTLNQRDRIAISGVRIAAATALRAIILLLRPREGADPSEACVSAARELAKETLETMERI